MTPLAVGRFEGLLLASLIVQGCAILDPQAAAELSSGIEQAALRLAFTDLKGDFTIQPGIVPTLEATA